MVPPFAAHTEFIIAVTIIKHWVTESAVLCASVGSGLPVNVMSVGAVQGGSGSISHKGHGHAGSLHLEVRTWGAKRSVGGEEREGGEVRLDQSESLGDVGLIRGSWFA